MKYLIVFGLLMFSACSDQDECQFNNGMKSVANPAAQQDCNPPIAPQYQPGVDCANACKAVGLKFNKYEPEDRSCHCGGEIK